MTTNNQLNLGLSGSTGTGSFVGSAGASLTGSPTLGGYAMGPVSAWTAYTPTFTGCGTVTNISIYSRRCGGNLDIFGSFTTGTSTAATAQMTLGINGTNNNITSAASIIFGTLTVGSAAINAIGAAINYCLMTASRGYMTFGYQGVGTSALTAANGSSIFGTGAVVSIQASIPCDTFP